MALPPWENLRSKIDSFKEAAEKKKRTFEGHEDILEISIKTSFLFIPKPLDRVAEVLYMNYNGTPQQKIDEVINYFKIVSEKDEEHYKKVKEELDDILNKLEDTKHDPVIKGNEDIVEKIKEILITDGQNRKQLMNYLSSIAAPPPRQ